MSLDKHLELRERTKKFALRILRMSRAIPNNHEANIISNQIIRSATGVAANYRAVGLARSQTGVYFRVSSDDPMTRSLT